MMHKILKYSQFKHVNVQQELREEAGVIKK